MARCEQKTIKSLHGKMMTRENFDLDGNDLHSAGVQNNLTDATLSPSTANMPTLGERETSSENTATTLAPISYITRSG